MMTDICVAYSAMDDMQHLEEESSFALFSLMPFQYVGNLSISAPGASGGKNGL
jgi:hypothetical protein